MTAFLLTCATASLAQSTSGELVGFIYDASGATVPNASVTGKNLGTGVKYPTAATAAGEYRLTNLPVGVYSLTVSAPKFASAELTNITVDLNKISTANVSLRIGAGGDSVDVSSSPPVIDTTTAQVSSTFESAQLADLPTTSSGSGVVNLALLNAGVGTSGAVGVGNGPSVGGQRPRNNNFTVEGIDNNSKNATGPLVTIPNDAVAEFTTIQNQFSPDFGHSSGGQFNQVVKSGGNAFHGVAYEYLQNRLLNAADNLSAVSGTPLHPRFDDNRFGGTLGGPILHNKLFFFANYEYQPMGGSASTGQVYAPTAAGYSAINSVTGISKTNLVALQQYLGTAPSAVSAASLGGYPLVGPGNESAADNPANWAKTAVPVPVGLVSLSFPSYTNSEAGVASIDYNISDKDALRGRFILNRQGSIDTGGFPQVFFTTLPTNNYLLAISEFHNFSPNVTNEFRLGYNRYSKNTPVGGNRKFPGLDQFPNLVVNELGFEIGPDPSAPAYAIQNTYQLTDNVTYAHGSHTFKFGFDGWKSISPEVFTQRSRGDYEWTYLSDYLNDYIPDSFAQRSLGGATYYGDQVFLGFYGNDTFKLRPNVTVNIGLRYEFETVPYTERQQTLNAAAGVPGLIVFGEPKPQKTDFMPRVGLAYSPGSSGKTSLRAGFGINYDVLYDNQGLLTVPPEFSTTVDVTGNPGQGFLAGGGIKPNASGAALSLTDLRAGTGGYVPDQTRPKSIQWNFGVQHVFASNYTVELRYLGSRGIDLPLQDQLNRQSIVNPSNALPVFFSQPSASTLNALTNTLSNLTASYNNQGYIVPAYLNAGFTGVVTSFQPWGNSSYHGLATQLTRRFGNGLQFVGSYTWSHTIDDSTTDVAATITTPRRAQDPRNLAPEKASSALDHRNRLTHQAIYDLPYFKESNWFLKNVVGNWELAPIYTFQTGNLYTIQSGIDSNLNGDSAGDRTVVNPTGNPSIGSGTKPLTNGAGQTVAYLVANPAAGYITAPKGTIATGGRNTAHFNPINDIDLTLAKRFTVMEGRKLEFAVRAFNVFNHPQYIGGSLNDVAPVGFTSGTARNVAIPTSAIFGDPTQAYSSNPRSLQVSAKFIF